MKLIMFDMDGTLYRTETSFFPAVQEFAVRHAFPSPDEAFLRRFIGQNAGGAWRTWIDRLQLDQPTDDLMQEFDLLEKQLVQERGQLYPGAAKTLREVAADGWTLGICSNASAWYPETILTAAGVRDLFSVIRVPSRSDETKAMMLCEVWNELHPERCAMVGDRADDMQAACAGGFTAVGAVYGWAPEELEQADIRIHDITELPAALAGRQEAVRETGPATAGTNVPPCEEAPEPAMTAAEAVTPSAPAGPETPLQAPDLPSEATPSPEPPVAPETSVKPATQVSTDAPLSPPEPPAAAPQTAPPASESAPQRTPEPVPAAPEPPEPAPAARRPWSLFHRRDDRSR